MCSTAVVLMNFKWEIEWTIFIFVCENEFFLSTVCVERYCKTFIKTLV